MRFGVDPPEEEGPAPRDPDQCDCGLELTDAVGPGGERDRVCPACDMKEPHK
jgi:hypothetical protein